jgi:hypothetical protein
VAFFVAETKPEVESEQTQNPEDQQPEVTITMSFAIFTDLIKNPNL